MDRNQAIAKLIAYALEKQLIQPEEKNWAVNTLLEMLELDGCALPEIPVGEQIDLPAVMGACWTTPMSAACSKRTASFTETCLIPG